MEISNFADIEAEFIQRVHTMVWCSAATIDSQGRPRSRILHPIWEGNTGWIGTHRNSHKAKHLAHNPHISLAYIMDAFKPVYVECVAEWDDSLEQKRRCGICSSMGQRPSVMIPPIPSSARNMKISAS